MFTDDKFSLNDNDTNNPKPDISHNFDSSYINPLESNQVDIISNESYVKINCESIAPYLFL